MHGEFWATLVSLAKFEQIEKFLSVTALDSMLKDDVERYNKLPDLLKVIFGDIQRKNVIELSRCLVSWYGVDLKR